MYKNIYVRPTFKITCLSSSVSVSVKWIALIFRIHRRETHCYHFKGKKTVFTFSSFSLGPRSRITNAKGEGRRQVSTRQGESPQKMLTLLTPWLWISSLRIMRNQFLFKLPCLWYFAVVDQANWYREKEIGAFRNPQVLWRGPLYGVSLTFLQISLCDQVTCQ